MTTMLDQALETRAPMPPPPAEHAASDVAVRLAPPEALVDRPPSAATRWMLAEVHRRSLAPWSASPLALGWGTDAAMLLDFGTARVQGHPLAWQRLRLDRQLPEPLAAGSGDTTMSTREMDRCLWDLGVAAGAHPLLNAPADWWHTPLGTVQLATVPRYTAHPPHLELARLLANGIQTPAGLYERSDVPAPELRCFIQAGLAVALLYWRPTSAN